MKVYTAKLPAWKIIRKIIAPKLKSPGVPMSSPDGDPFLLSELDETEYIETGGLIDAIKALIPLIKYSWRTNQLKMVLQFMTVGAIGLIINILIVKGLISIGVISRIAGIIGTIVTIFTNFLINDSWTFKQHKENRPWLHRLIGYYATSLGTMILQIIIYEVLITFIGVTLSIIISVGVSYVLRLIYIRDKVYKYQ